MRKKRFLSAVLTSALVATMAVPAMAADTGTVNVVVGDKTAVLKVTVPTKLVVEVDPLEIGEAGTQIYSGIFDIANQSEVPVQVSVDSVLTVDSGINVVASRAAVSGDSAGVWMAAAAKTATDSYDDVRTTNVNEDFKSLSEGNSNVAAFDTTNKKANQVYYLEKGAGEVSYKVLSANGSSDKAPAYTQVYPLTLNATVSTNDDLQTLVNSSDVYYILSSNVSGADMEGSVTATKIAKDTQDVTYASENAYYTAGAKVNGDGSASLAAGLNVYGTTANEGGVAGFRYIGELSDQKASWSSTDISNISITYNITGIKADTYDEEKDYCVYGLKGDTKVGPTMTLTPAGVLTISGLTGAYKELYIEGVNAADGIARTKVEGANVGWDLTNYNKETGGTLVITFGDAWKTWLSGKTIKVELTLADDSQVTTTATLN